MRQNATAVLGLSLLLAAALFPLATDDLYILHSAAMVLYFAYMAPAWNFVCGYVGQLSLGHAVFSSRSGYATVLLFTMTGLGGAFYAQLFRYINPEPNMGVDLSTDFAIMAVVGGRGTILGPTIGALILHPLGEVTRAALGERFLGLHLVVYGAALPSVLALDEPSLGLAPIMVDRLFDSIRRIKETGLTLLVIEQNVFQVLDMADKGLAPENGVVALSGTGPELLADSHLRATYLGL